MRPETKGRVLVAHHGDKTHNNPYYHSVVAKGIIPYYECQTGQFEKLACLGITGAMKTAPTVS
jgi:hypothetical protein